MTKVTMPQAAYHLAMCDSCVYQYPECESQCRKQHITLQLMDNADYKERFKASQCGKQHITLQYVFEVLAQVLAGHNAASSISPCNKLLKVTKLHLFSHNAASSISLCNMCLKY